MRKYTVARPDGSPETIVEPDADDDSAGARKKEPPPAKRKEPSPK